MLRLLFLAENRRAAGGRKVLVAPAATFRPRFLVAGRPDPPAAAGASRFATGRTAALVGRLRPRQADRDGGAGDGLGRPAARCGPPACGPPGSGSLATAPCSTRGPAGQIRRSGPSKRYARADPDRRDLHVNAGERRRYLVGILAARCACVEHRDHGRGRGRDGPDPTPRCRATVGRGLLRIGPFLEAPRAVHTPHLWATSGPANRMKGPCRYRYVWRRASCSAAWLPSSWRWRAQC